MTSILGKRPNNEDAHAIFSFNNYYVAALFDGHNGGEVSKICAQTIEEFFKKHIEDGDDMKDVLQGVVNDINKLILRNE